MPPADREPRQHARASCPRRQDPHLRTATPRITESVTEPARWHLFATLFGTTAACQRPASATDSAKQCGQKLPNNSAIHTAAAAPGRGDPPPRGPGAFAVRDVQGDREAVAAGQVRGADADRDAVAASRRCGGVIRGGEGGRCEFRHPLFREAVYEDLPAPVRVM